MRVRSLVLPILSCWPAVASADPCQDVDSQLATSAELRALADDAVRSSLPDAEALATVRAHDEAGRLCSAEDAFLAATVLKRGQGADLERAVALARRAHEGRWSGAGYLLALTTDLWRVSAGEPQSYGTLTAQEEGRHCIYPVDPAVTDADRRALGARALEESYARLLQRNGLDLAPTEASIRSHVLWCASRVREEGSTAPIPQVWSAKPMRLPHDQDRTLSNGEQWGPRGGWSGTAWTVEPGTFVLRPLLRSGFGLTEGVDVKTSILGWIVQPNVALEVAPIRTDTFALSVEGQALSDWSFSTTSLHGTLHTSTGAGHGLLNVNGWVSTVLFEGEPLTLGAGPELGYDLHLGDKASVVFNGRLDAVALADGVTSLAAGARYVWAGEKVGGAVGFEVTELVRPWFGDAPTAWLPLPQLEIWMKQP